MNRLSIRNFIIYLLIIHYAKGEKWRWSERKY
jgi:hypothetical protein